MKNKDTYHEEDWKQEAPFLASLRDTEGMEVPDGYFEGFPEKMIGRIKAEGVEVEKLENENEEDWKGSAPLLATLQESGNEEVPANYFEDFPGKMMDRIQAEESQADSPAPAKIVRFRPLHYVAIAASIALMIGVGLFLNSLDNGPAVDPDGMLTLSEEMRSLDAEELLFELNDVDEAEILALMADDAFEYIDRPDELDEESILDFLDDTDLDDFDLENITL